MQPLFTAVESRQVVGRVQSFRFEQQKWTLLTVFWAQLKPAAQVTGDAVVGYQ